MGALVASLVIWSRKATRGETGTQVRSYRRRGGRDHNDLECEGGEGRNVYILETSQSWSSGFLVSAPPRVHSIAVTVAVAGNVQRNIPDANGRG